MRDAKGEMNMALSDPVDKQTPAWKILEYLQRNGSASIKTLEEHLGVTTTAVRQQLQALQASGYVERQSVHAGVGRPHHEYSMKPKAQELFSCHSDELALSLLEEVMELAGRETTERLLGRVGSRLAAQYLQSVEAGELSERVGQLVDALAARGVLADMSIDDEDIIVLQTYNCPYHELAQEHRDICNMDEKFMREVLGSEVSLSECMFDGHHRCTFVVGQSVSELSDM
jgi:DeoR family suf operon transcriptional repressor